MQNDFMTVLRLNKRANKLVSRDEAGELRKEPGPPITTAAAVTVYVPDEKALVELLADVAEDPKRLLIPSGYFPGMEPEESAPLSEGEEFRISSRKFLADHLGVDRDDTEKLLGWHDIGGQRHIARLKANIVAGCWMLFDRDDVKGMPAELANLSDDGWLSAMSEMVPGLAEIPKVMVPSSTGRVLVDGKPMAASGRHYYVQIIDGNDLDRFGAVLLQRSFLQGYGFMRPLYSKDKPDQVVGNRQWSIFDPTTFSRERLAYEGAPTIEGRGLALAPSRIKVL